MAGVLLTVTAMLAAPFVPTLLPSAAADPCPDVDVVFARGTGEDPGVGRVGQAFIDALRANSVVGPSRCTRWTTRQTATF